MSVHSRIKSQDPYTRRRNTTVVAETCSPRKTPVTSNSKDSLEAWIQDGVFKYIQETRYLGRVEYQTGRFPGVCAPVKEERLK